MWLHPGLIFHKATGLPGAKKRINIIGGTGNRAENEA